MTFRGVFAIMLHFYCFLTHIFCSFCIFYNLCIFVFFTLITFRVFLHFYIFCIFCFKTITECICCCDLVRSGKIQPGVEGILSMDEHWLVRSMSVSSLTRSRGNGFKWTQRCLKYYFYILISI